MELGALLFLQTGFLLDKSDYLEVRESSVSGAN